MANTVSYIYEILDRYSAPLRKISKETGRFDAIIKASEKNIKKFSAALSILKKNQTAVNRSFSKTNINLTKLHSSIPNVTRGIGKIVASGKYVSKTAGQFGELRREISKIRTEAEKASAKLLGVTRRPKKGFAPSIKGGRLGKFAETGQEMRGALGAFGITAGLISVVKASSDMEDAMSDIGRVTDISAKGLLKFEDKLEKLSESLGKSKRGLAEMAFEGGKLGVPIENMEQFLIMTSKTAIAFDMIDQEAGRSIGSIQAKMGLMGKDAERLLDSMNYLADTTSANGERMIEITERLSGTFRMLELPPEVAAAFAGFADQIEITPQLAASGLNMMIRQMRKMPGMTTKLMADPVGVVNEQLARMAKMGPELRNKYIMKVFGPEAAKFVEKAVGNVDLFGKTVEKAMSTKAAGSMQRELENQLGRSSKVFQIFSETVTNTLDAIGDAIKPMARLFARITTPIIDLVGMLAKGSPIFVRLVAVIGAAVAAFTGLAVIAGILSAAFAPLMAAIAAISFPMWIMIAAVTSAVLLFSEWEASGHPIIRMFGEIFDDIGAILKPIAELLGLVDESSSGFDILGSIIEKLGYAIIFILTPLKMLLKGLKGVVEAGVALASGDLGAAFDAIKAVKSDIVDIGVESGQAVMATLGVESSKEALKTKQGAQGVNITGGIAVTSTGGAQIEKSEINLNGGANLAYGG